MSMPIILNERKNQKLSHKNQKTRMSPLATSFQHCDRKTEKIKEIRKKEKREGGEREEGAKRKKRQDGISGKEKQLSVHSRTISARSSTQTPGSTASASEMRVGAETNAFSHIGNEQEELESTHNFISTNAS